MKRERADRTIFRDWPITHPGSYGCHHPFGGTYREAVVRLERLFALWRSNALTEDEYTATKTELLSRV
jgi:hypothetical protein